MIDERIAHRLGGLALVVAACGGPKAMPTATTATAPPEAKAPRPAQPSFCSQAYAYCEDFTEVSEGSLPVGWIGGDGLMVTRAGSKSVLSPYQARNDYRVTIPWTLDGNYLVEWVLATAQDANRVTVGVGNVDVSLSSDGLGRWNLGLGATETGEYGGDQYGSGGPAKQIHDTEWGVDDFFKETHYYAIARTDDVYKVSLDGQQLLVGRYDGLPAPTSITLSGGGFSAGGGFILSGIRATSTGGDAAP